MAAGHAPHTPPLWRQFLSLPQTRQGWLAVGLASPSLLIMAFSVVPTLLWGGGLLDMNQAGILGTVVFPIIWVFSGLVGGAAAWGAVRGEHERSLLVVVSMVPGLLLVASVLLAGIFVGLMGLMRLM